MYARYIYNLANINVNWTTYHSGNGSEQKGYSDGRYRFHVGGASSSANYYTHRFTTGVIQITEPSILDFDYVLFTGNNDSASGTVTIYNASGTQLYTASSLGSHSSTVNVPAGGFYVYLNYYGPGNWFGDFIIRK